MGKLIKLEWEKYEIGKYIRNAAILIVLLVIFNYAMTFLGIANDPDTGVPDMAIYNICLLYTSQCYDFNPMMSGGMRLRVIF